MTHSINSLRNSMLSVAICAGLGLATLPTETQARYCMMNKPQGHMGHMNYYGPYYNKPMMQHGYGHHHHGMHSHKVMHGKHGGYGKSGSYSEYGSYGESASSYGGESAKTSQAPEPVNNSGKMGSDTSGPDIIETAAAAQNFKTLIRAAEAAGLYDVLRGDGPFTVFAPSDAAFDNLPDGTLEALLADREKLVAVLSFHVVPERLTAADLLQQREFTTVQGQRLSLDKLSVASADIKASNGMIHVINEVLIPEQ